MLLYTPELAAVILDHIASGKSLRATCRLPEVTVAERTVRGWALDDVDGFAARFARASMVGIAGLADELLEIADAATDKDSAAAARVQCENRRWLLSKLLPKVFGDKLDVHHSGSVTVAALLSEARQRRSLLDDRAALSPRGQGLPITLDGVPG